MPNLHLDMEALTASIAPPDLPHVPTPQVNIPSITPVETLLATTMPDVPHISTPSFEGLFTLTSLTQSISAINASPIPPIPNVDARLIESAELSLSQVVIDLGNLPDLLAAPLRTVESAAAAAAEEAVTFSLAGAERIALVGDSHANLLWMIRSLRLVSKSGISHVVVLGDFGYWPRMTLGREFIDAVAAEALRLKLHVAFLDGNRGTAHCTTPTPEYKHRRSRSRSAPPSPRSTPALRHA